MPLFPHRDILLVREDCSFASVSSWPGILSRCCPQILYLQRTLKIVAKIIWNPSISWYIVTVKYPFLKSLQTYPEINSSMSLLDIRNVSVEGLRFAAESVFWRNIVIFLSACTSISVPILIYLRLVFQVHGVGGSCQYPWRYLCWEKVSLVYCRNTSVGKAWLKKTELHKRNKSAESRGRILRKRKKCTKIPEHTTGADATAHGSDAVQTLRSLFWETRTQQIVGGKLANGFIYAGEQLYRKLTSMKQILMRFMSLL